MKMQKILPLLGLLALPLTSQADTLGAYIGGGMWTHTPSGGVTMTQSADLSSELGLSGASESYLYVVVDHPVPMIPNVKIVQTNNTNSGTIATSLTFNGQSLTTADSATVQLNSTNYIFYYRLLDNIVKLNVGLAGYAIDGRVKAGTTVNQPFAATIPMGYMSVGATIPGTGLSGQYETTALSIGGASLTDTTIKVMYEFGSVVGVEAGTRTQALNISTAISGVSANMSFSGAFVGAYVHF